MYTSIVSNIQDHKWIRNILIQLSFLLLSVMFFYIFWIHNTLEPSQQDLLFNYQRLEEIWKSISHLQIPQFNKYTVLPYGLATPTMYPWLLAVPLLLVKPFFTTIHLIIFMYESVIFMGLNITFYTCSYSRIFNKMSHKYIYCYIVSCLYMLSEFTAYDFVVSDIGALCEMSIIPLVFFGWIRWIKSGKGFEMLIGLVLVAYCHILGVFISGIVLFLLTVIFYRRALYRRWKSLLHLIILFVLMTAIIWIPILFLSLYGDMIYSQSMASWDFGVIVPKTFPSISSFIGIAMFPAVVSGHIFSYLVGLILGLFFYKQLPEIIDRCYIWGIILFVIVHIATANMFQNVKGLSYIGRSFEYSHLCIALVLAYVLTVSLPQFLKVHHFWSFLLIVVGMFALNIYGEEQVDIKCLSSGRPLIIKMKQLATSKQNIRYMKLYSKKKLTNKELNSQRLIHFQSHYDYFPAYYKRTYANANSILVGKHILRAKPQNNGIIRFHTNKYHSKVNVPVAVYKGQKSIIKLDHHRTQWSLSKLGSVQLHDVHKGNHQVQIKNPIMWYRWLSYILSIMGILLFGIDCYKHRDIN